MWKKQKERVVRNNLEKHDEEEGMLKVLILETWKDLTTK